MSPIARVLQARPPHWVGDGFPVRSLFDPQTAGSELSPFLLLDHASPTEFPPSDKPHGVGEHPHRGFETVTIVYQGEVEHRDSAGHGGRIGPGDVQWMTAARGVVHEEMHARDFARRGGAMEMVQLWVNLPARHKMAPPAYQTLEAAAIPTVALPNGAGTARVIAGTLGGAKGPARTFTPINVWDLRLIAGTSAAFDVPAGQTKILVVLAGRVALESAPEKSGGGGRAEERVFGASEGALFARADAHIQVRPIEKTTALLLTGEPIDEPIAAYGPFVMNTQHEIRQAIRDYQAGRLGSLSE